MAKKCKRCGTPLSDNATKCPKCGTEVKSPANETVSSNQNLKQHDSSRGNATKWIVAVIFVGVLCGAGYYFYQHQKQQQDAEALELAEQHRADSIAAVNRELAILDSLRQDSIDRINYTAPDLAFAELHGKVKTCLWKNKHLFDGKLNFSENGTLSPNKDQKFTRDENGQIIKLNYKEPNVYDQDHYEFNYVWKDNKIISDSFTSWDAMGESKYTYDKDGLLIKETSESGAEGYEWVTTIIYSDYKFDECGNWIKRKVKTIETESFDGSVQSTNTTYDTETRTITYYE